MSLISPNAAINANGVVFFMDRGNFYMYTGGVEKLNCTVLTTVFHDFDLSQSHKVVAGSNPDFSEVIWFYPSESGNGENDRYVIYNYEDSVWCTGSLVRGTWNQANTKSYPLASSILLKSFLSVMLSNLSTNTNFIAYLLLIKYYIKYPIGFFPSPIIVERVLNSSSISYHSFYRRHHSIYFSI